MGLQLPWRQHRQMTYWVVEADTTTIDVEAVAPHDAITLTIRGPLAAVALQRDGVERRSLPELRLERLRFAEGDGVVERLHRWAAQVEDVAVSLGCLMDRRGTVHAATLSGVIADWAGNDIVFGDADLTAH